MESKFLKRILREDQTVFSFKELLLQFKPDDLINFQSQLNYYVKQGELHRIRRGLYAKDKNYNRLELATKILIPSYISFETVLRSAGIIFQYYSQIFVASYQSREIICDDQAFVFRRIKPKILTNPSGISIGDHYSIATPERAFLDTVYLNKNYHFDNLKPLDWKKVLEMMSMYENKEMESRVEAYFRNQKGNQ